MVRIKFTALSWTPAISSEFESMASDEALEISVQRKEALTEQHEESLMEQQREALVEAVSPHGEEYNRESKSWF
jgi:hypothetical protein